MFGYGKVIDCAYSSGYLLTTFLSPFLRFISCFVSIVIFSFVPTSFFNTQTSLFVSNIALSVTFYLCCKLFSLSNPCSFNFCSISSFALLFILTGIRIIFFIILSALLRSLYLLLASIISFTLKHLSMISWEFIFTLYLIAFCNTHNIIQ